MNLDALVCPGREPWAPSRHASDLDVWHYDDIPTLGTFMSGASLVLFLLLDEPSDRATTWCYLPLGDEKAATLDGMTFDTMDHMMTTVHECFQGREAVFARATRYRISQWGRQTVSEGVYAAALTFLEQIATSLELEVKRLRRERRRAAPQPALALPTWQSMLTQYSNLNLEAHRRSLTTSEQVEEVTEQLERIEALEDATR